jgi:threonine dehydrogenase-like Zn-dependent dehydrogenase
MLDQHVPSAHGDLVVVKVLAVPMCTEFKQRSSGRESNAIGHEAAGVVVDAGTSHRVSVGDRVVVMPNFACGKCSLCLAGDHIYCPNQRDVLAETGQSYGTATYAEYLIKPDWLLVPVPDDIPLIHAALACCGLGPSFTAAQRTRVNALGTLVVSGCGPVGLGAVIQGRVRDARTIAIESHPFRARLALALGAERVIDPTASTVPDEVRVSLPDGADSAIETSGAPTAASALAQSLRVKGRMGIVSWGNDITLPPLPPLGIAVYGCWHWNHQQHTDEMFSVIRAASPLLDTFITHVMPLEAVSDAMDLQDSGNCGKVILLPHGEIPDEGLTFK